MHPLTKAQTCTHGFAPLITTTSTHLSFGDQPQLPHALLLLRGPRKLRSARRYAQQLQLYRCTQLRQLSSEAGHLGGSGVEGGVGDMGKNSQGCSKLHWATDMTRKA